MLKRIKKFRALIFTGSVSLTLLWYHLVSQEKSLMAPDKTQRLPFLLASHAATLSSEDTWSTSALKPCPDILSGMTKGHWITRPLSEEEQATIDKYLREERAAFNIPPNYQREDNRCGKLPYQESPLFRHMWFRAICDPKGPTPCCHDSRCISATEEECRCGSCYDERQAIHAEFASWQSSEHSCNVKQFTRKQACALLGGSTLYFIGDSFIRHVFATLVIVLTGNKVNGALRKDIKSDERQRCSGVHQITGAGCKVHLDPDRILCDGTVKVKYMQVFVAREFVLTPPVLRTLRKVRKSLIVLGFGIHDDFNARDVVKWFLLPFLNLRQYLSTNLSQDVNLLEVLTNFGNFNESATLFDLNSKDIYPSTNKSNSAFHYDSLLQRNTDNVLGSPNLEVGPFALPLFFAPNTGENNAQIVRDAIVKSGQQLTSSKPLVSHNSSKTPILFEVQPQRNRDIKKLWPRLLWIGAHGPGLLKSPKFKAQTAEGVQVYNQRIQEILKLWQVAYLETFSFSNGTVSFDGTHYGWGINKLKVDMMLTYIDRMLSLDSLWKQGSD